MYVKARVETPRPTDEGTNGAFVAAERSALGAG